MTTTTATREVGSIVVGKYRLDRVLGRGGMGTVYEATQLELDAPVAIKFLHPMFAATSELRERFRREAVALARLRHRGIVSLLDFGNDEGEAFMVMERIDGCSLADFLEGGPLSIPRIGEIFDELLEALAAAHAIGIVHRDIKPSNVMITTENHVKLLDFGLVQLPSTDPADKLTDTGIIHGTPEYMSPEQCQAEEIGPASDVYSVGVMLFECLAGVVPFEGRGAQVMAQHIFVEPPKVRDLESSASVPPGLDDLLRRALAKSADTRPTASEMRLGLATVLAGTDARTLAEGASRERSRMAALSRSERAITGRPPKAEPSTPELGEPAPVRGVTVAVTGSARAGELRSLLAVAKIPRTPEGAEPTVVIVSALDGVGRVVAEARERHPKALVLAVDVAGVDAMRDCIRQGASDVVLAGTADTEIAGRAGRLLRRGR